jgi:hypothetical protein
MTLPGWLRLAEITLVLLLAGAVILAWREARSDRAQLQSQLAAANQAIAAATARQQDHNAKLSDALAAIAAEKKAAVTPGQLLAAIAQEVGLPSPLSLQSAKPRVNSPAGNPSATPASPILPSPSLSSSSQPSRNLPSPSPPSPNLPSPSSAAPSTELPSAPAAQIPAADLQPLYDYVLNCKACQAKLNAAQADLADEKLKTTALTQSRDAALRAAKGGSTWQRTTRALKWFAIGAAAGALAAKTAHQ